MLRVVNQPPFDTEWKAELSDSYSDPNRFETCSQNWRNKSCAISHNYCVVRVGIEKNSKPPKYFQIRRFKADHLCKIVNY